MLLAGLGLRKLSMSQSSIAGVKAALAKVTIKEAQLLGAACKNMRTQEEVCYCSHPS